MELSPLSFKFNEGEFQNVPPIVIKAIGAICEHLKDIDKFATNTNKSVQKIIQDVNRVDVETKRLDKLDKDMRRVENDTREFAQKKVDLEAQTRTEEIKQALIQSEERCAKLDRDLKSVIDQHTRQSHIADSEMTKLSNKITELSDNASVVSAKTELVGNQMKNTLSEMDALKIQTSADLAAAVNQLDSRINELKRASNVGEVRKDLVALEQRINEEKKMRENGDNKLVENFGIIRAEVNRVTEKMDKHTRSMGDFKKDIDDIRREVHNRVFEVRDEVLKTTAEELVNRTEPLVTAVHALDDRLQAAQDDVVTLQRELTEPVRREFEEMADRVREVEDRIGGITDGPQAAQITEARLFTLEARLKQEEENRISEQNAITQTLNTVVQCIDHNTKMLETKADRKRTEKALQTKADRTSMFYGAVTTRRPPTRTKGFLARAPSGKKGHLYYSPEDAEEFGANENQPLYEQMPNINTGRSKSSTRMRPSSTPGLGGNRAQPLKRPVSQPGSRRAQSGATGMADPTWPERTADEIMMNAHSRNQQNAASAVGGMQPSRLVPSPMPAGS